MDKKRIMIVEDDMDLVRALEIRLRANNYDTAYATDVDSAISLIQEKNPDLVLLDLGLPGGDGCQVMERLRAISRFASTPVIIVTARTQMRERLKSLAAGATYYFEKPADNIELLGAIAVALREPAHTA